MAIVSVKHLSIGLLLALASLTGCGGSEGLLEARGKITAASGKTAPEHATVDVVWGVSSGSPDYSYVFGTADATSDGFDLSFTADPPAEALNSYGIGVGALVLMPDGASIPEGKLTSDAEGELESKAIGAAGNYAIIYKKAGAMDLSWSGAFPEGYSCAKGVPAQAGETFDTFEPVDCAELVITVDSLDNIDFTNWT